MKLRHFSRISWLMLAVGAVMAQASGQTWTGATNATWQTASNWNTAVPTSTGTAVFDASSTQNLAITSTAATTIRGLRVVDPAGAISLAGSGLSLGTGGIDMATATQNLTISSAVTILTGNQNWSVADGRTLALGAVPIRNNGANNNNVGGLLRAGTTGIIRLGTAASSAGVIHDGGGNPFVTYGLDDWAGANATGQLVATAYTSNAFTPNTNVSIDTAGDYATATGNPSFNSVRFNNADGPVTVSNPGSGNSPTYRGILMTSTAQAVTINLGNVRPGRVSTAGASFSIVQNSTLGDLTMNSVIPNASSSTPVSVVKSGSGRLVLGGGNGFTGRTFINEGIVQLGSGSTTGSIATASEVVTQPGTTFAVNRSNAVALPNVISGGGQFTQLGSGSTTLSGSNTFTGPVNADGGALVFSTASNLGNGTAINFNSGTLVYAGGNTTDISTRTITLGASGGAIDTGANNVSFASAIGNGGAGGFTKVGTGRLTLAAGGNYAGSTTVAGGELRVNGPLSSPTVSVAANTLLSGTGTLSGAVTLDNAATLAPGNAAVGSLTLGSLTTSGGSSLIWEFNTSPANDLVVVSSPNGLTINGGTFSFFSEGTATPFGTLGTYNLIQYSGAVQGSGVGSLAVANPAAGKSYTFGESGGFVTLTIASSGLLAQWNVDAAGTWTTAANWTPSEPNGAGDTATFGSVITAPRTVTLNADRTVGNVVFDNANAYTIAPAAAQTLTIGDGSGSRQLQVVTGSHTISAPVALASNVGVDVVTGQAVALTGPVSGGGALTKTSGGTLLLSGSNSYTGDTTVAGGTVEFTAGAISSGVVTLGGGGVKYASGNTEDLSAKTVNLAFGGGTVDTGGNDVTFANSIGNFGVGGLTKSGSGTLTLQGANTYTGQTTVRGGVLSVSADANLGDAGTAAGIVLDGGTLRTTAGFTTSRVVTTATGSGIDVPGEADTLTLNGVVTGAGLITKSGSGTLVLTGANTAYTGGLTLAGGTVTLGSGRANGFQGIGTGPIAFQNGAVLNLNGYNQGDNGTTWGTLTGPISVAAGQSGVINMPQRGTIASTLTGSGTLGLNVQFIRGELTGNWSGFTGQLNVGTVAGQTTGDFRLNATTGFGTAAVNLGPGVTMFPVINYANSPQTFTIGELSGDATAVVTGQGGVNSGRIALYSVGGRNTNATFAGSIRDGLVSSAVQPAAITKVGTGVWTLTGTSTFTGATTVNGGTLYVATDAATNPSGGLAGTSGITINNGGTLRSGTNALFGSIPGQAKPITINAGGVATADDGADVMVGVVTLAGGTLASSGSSVSNGSWVFDGATTSLVAAENSTVSAVNVRMQNGATVDVAAAKTLVFAGSITDAVSAGASTLIKTGSGTLALNGASTYTGPTTISAGTLLANTNLTATAITTAADAAIGGSGTVGSVTMSAGALVSPGNGLGTLTVAQNLTLTGSSGYLWQLTNATGTAGSTTGWDLLTVTGTLDIAATSADPFHIDLWTLTTGSTVTSGSAANFNREQSYTWKIASAAGGISGFAADKFVINTSATNGTGGFANSFTGGTFSLTTSGNDLNLVFTGAPPSVITIDVPSGTQTQTQAGYPTLSGSVPVLKIGAGTLVLDQANTLSGSTTVQGGVLQLANGSALAGSRFVVVAGGTGQVAPYTSTSVASLDLASGNGLLDLTSGALTISSGLTATALVAEILEGRGDGSWTGTSGITSSTAAAESAAGTPRAVGWIDNGDGSLMVAYAAPGDTNIDWSIDILDASNFLAGGKFDTGSPAVWIEGDFSYDGVVDILDAADFFATGLYDAGNYNTAPGLSGGIAAVPEPTGVAIVAGGCIAAAALLRRRGRRS
jgi:autotransporter-associated beta strand protein